MERARYGRVPKEVLRDSKLKNFAKVVYGELAMACFEGPQCTIGQRELARRLGKSQAQVSICVKNLVERGHIEVKLPEGEERTRRGVRKVYRMTSPIFRRRSWDRWDATEEED